jgi:hypothetical protein
MGWGSNARAMALGNFALAARVSPLPSITTESTQIARDLALHPLLGLEGG